MDAWQVPMNHVRRAIDRSALYFCGFPTLQHIKHKVNYGMDVIAVVITVFCSLYVALLLLHNPGEKMSSICLFVLLDEKIYRNS